MEQKKEQKSNKEPIKRNTKRDVVLWVLIAIAIAGGVVANFYYSDVAWTLRLAGWIVLVGILSAMALQTAAGDTFWTFAKAARMELRKVVWPTRQETLHTTAVIIGLVVLVALILWGVDTLLMWIISWVTG